MELLKKSDITHRQLSSSKTGEAFSLSAILSDGLKLKDLFIHHEILLPGRRASGAHFHKTVDEVVYILKGSCAIHEGEKRFVAQVGDCVSFAAGSGLPHFVENDGQEVVEMLVISKATDDSDVVAV